MRQRPLPGLNLDEAIRSLDRDRCLIYYYIFMQHRHLNHTGYTIASIDDIIARGKRADWAQLKDVLDSRPKEIKPKILAACNAYAQDSHAQRQRLWKIYVERKDA